MTEITNLRNCPICDGSNLIKIADLTSTFNGPLSRASFELVKCNACDTIYENPLPLQPDFTLMYECTVQFGDFDYRDSEVAKNILEYYDVCYRRMLQIMRRDAETLLEIGAGPAWVSRAAKNITQNVKTVAQDVAGECAARTEWVDQYIVGTIDHPAIAEKRPYDIVSLTHVIEHLPDPVDAVSKLTRLMSDDGCLFITAPHRPDEWSKDPSPERWRSWSYNHVPGHIQYLSNKSLLHIADAAGLELWSWCLAESGQAFEAILRRLNR